MGPLRWTCGDGGQGPNGAVKKSGLDAQLSGAREQRTLESLTGFLADMYANQARWENSTTGTSDLLSQGPWREKLVNESLLGGCAANTLRMLVIKKIAGRNSNGRWKLEN